MKNRVFSSNRAGMQSKRRVIASITRGAGLVAIIVTLTVLLLPTAAVHAQVTTRAEIILSFLGLTDENFKGTIIENDGVLDIDGTRVRVVNGTEIAETIKLTFTLRTSAFTFQPLGPAGNPNAGGSGTNINGDGSCVVGYQDSGFSTPFHAFRWTEATGPVDLGTLDPPNNASLSSVATDTNQDCSVVVGISNTTNTFTEHAFRWTSGGMIDLGVPANGGPVSRGLGTSADGTVVVGDADFPDPENLISGKSRKAFRWTQAGGFQSLGNLQPAGISIATAVTADGTTVVGQASTNSGSSAFRWTTQNPIMEPIGPLPGHARAAATAVSDNGKIVVGISHPDFLQYQGPGLGWNQGTAFRWTQTGIKELRQVLIDSGVDMTGINLVTVTGISPDGQWIVGDATTSQTGPNETVPYVVQVCDEDIGGSCSGTSPQTFLTIVKSGTGSGTVTSSLPGISCGATCSASYATGSVVTLSASADAGSYLAGWSAPCPESGTCTLTLTADTPITATFSPPGYGDVGQKLYIGYYQRPADPGGLAFWKNGLATVDVNHDGNFVGEDIIPVLTQFAFSAEARALYGGDITSSNIGTVIDKIYQGLFGRDPEADGKAFWVNSFNTGASTPATILWELMKGAQGTDAQTTQNRLVAASRFTQVIDPNLSGQPPFQATYGANDIPAVRTWLAGVTWEPATTPSQDETIVFIKTNIADPGDPISNP